MIFSNLSYKQEQKLLNKKEEAEAYLAHFSYESLTCQE